MTLNFPPSSESPFTAPSGVIYTWSSGGFWDGRSDRANDSVNVKYYGAVGNGSDDDTAAIQAALTGSSKGVYFPPGSYCVSNTLISEVADRKIWGDAATIVPHSSVVNSGIYRMFLIKGDNTEFSLNCDGKKSTSIFVAFNAKNPFVHHCQIENLGFRNTTLSDKTSKAIAIDIKMYTPNGIDYDSAFTVTDNIIKNLEALPNSLNPDGSHDYGRGGGLSRAINFEAHQTISSPILIADNTIDTVHGAEGDAISLWNFKEVKANGTGTDAGGHNYTNVLVSNNQIHNFNRRGIKVKVSGARIEGNHFYNSWGSSDVATELKSPQGVVDLVDGFGHIVTGNILTNCANFNGIKVVTSGDPRNVSDMTITDNIFQRYSDIGSSPSLIFFQMNAGDGANIKSNLIIMGNVINCPNFKGIGIKVQEADRVIIANNAVMINDEGTPYFTAFMTDTESVNNLTN